MILNPANNYLNFIIILFLICSINHGSVAENRLTDLDTYTKEELEKLPKFRAKVMHGLTQKYMVQNKYLVRHLRAANLDVDVAEKNMRENWIWRKQFDADSLIHRNFSKIFKLFPFYFIRDNEGRPACVSALKDLNVRQHILTGTVDQIRNYLRYAAERITWNIHLASNETGREIIQGTIVFNMAGFNVRNTACVACLPLWIELAESYERYYPQIFQKIIVINTPRIFQSLVTLVKPIVTGYTFKSLQVYGLDRSEWAPALLKIYPKERLPLEFGGTRRINQADYVYTPEEIAFQLGATSKWAQTPKNKPKTI